MRRFGRDHSQRVEDNAFHLQLYRAANEETVTQSKSPWIMGGACNTNSRIGDNIHCSVRVACKTVPWIGAQIHLVLATRNAERLR